MIKTDRKGILFSQGHLQTSQHTMFILILMFFTKKQVYYLSPIAILFEEALFQTSDGSNALAIGKLGGIDKVIAIAGGNCSLQGYDKDGEEAFWTVCYLQTIIVRSVLKINISKGYW